MDNNEKNKTIVIVIIAIAAVCACMLLSCCAFTFYAVSKMDKENIIEVLNNNNDIMNDNKINISAENTQNNADDSTEAADDGSGLSSAERKIITETEKIRGITAKEKLAPIYKTEDELREYLMDQLNETSDEELAEELGLYNILAFAPKDFDLRQFYVEMYTEQIAGFYDPAENEMYLIQGDSDYDNALTLSHEYTHYLQYNNPDFDSTLKYEDDFCEDHGETCIIIDAIVEGDATLMESLLEPETILGTPENNSNNGSAAESSIFDSSPKFFQDSLLFPYLYGFDFVAYHYLKGGYDAVDKLFVELPESVEQIMHPEKYMNDSPINVTLEPFRSLIEEDFEIVQEDVMNESDVLMLLGSSYNEDWQLSERQAVAGSAGWGGGSYIYATNDEKPLFFTKLVWDSEKEAIEAETTFSLYSDKRFGPQTGNNSWSAEEDNSKIYLIRQEDVLYWMILPENFKSEELIDLINNGSTL